MYTEKIHENAIKVNLNGSADDTMTTLITKRHPLFKAISRLNELEEKELPKPPKIQPWSPAECPSCGCSLSKSLGDGYYEHLYGLERCPKCNQLILWFD